MTDKIASLKDKKAKLEKSLDRLLDKMGDKGVSDTDDMAILQKSIDSAQAGIADLDNEINKIEAAALAELERKKAEEEAAAELERKKAEEEAAETEKKKAEQETAKSDSKGGNKDAELLKGYADEFGSDDPELQKLFLQAAQNAEKSNWDTGNAKQESSTPKISINDAEAGYFVVPNIDGHIPQKWQYEPAKVATDTKTGNKHVFIKGEDDAQIWDEAQAQKYLIHEKDLSEVEPLKSDNGERCVSDYCIAAIEKLISKLPATQDIYKVNNGGYTKDRQKLHKKILDDILSNKNCIKSRNPVAVIMGGSSGSGKSTFLKKLIDSSDTSNVLLLDNDEIKKHIPEFKGWNAAVVHEEAGEIFNAAMEQVISKHDDEMCRHDFIWDGTMGNERKYRNIITYLQNNGYDVYVIYVKLPVEVAKKRVKERYKRSGRYVPEYIAQSTSETSPAVFGEIKSLADGYVLVDGEKMEIIESGGQTIPSRLFPESAETLPTQKDTAEKDKAKTDMEKPTKSENPAENLSDKYMEGFTIKITGINDKENSAKKLLGSQIELRKRTGNGVYVDIVEQGDVSGTQKRIGIVRKTADGEKSLLEFVTKKPDWWNRVAVYYKSLVSSSVVNHHEGDADKAKQDAAQDSAELKEKKRVLQEMKNNYKDLEESGNMDSDTRTILDEGIKQLQQDIAAATPKPLEARAKDTKKPEKDKLPVDTEKGKKTAALKQTLPTDPEKAKKIADKNENITQGLSNVIEGVFKSAANIIDGSTQKQANDELNAAIAKDERGKTKRRGRKKAYEKMPQPQGSTQTVKNAITGEKRILGEKNYEKANVYLVPLGDILVNKSAFQNRKTDYALDTYNNMIREIKDGTFKLIRMDAILLWRDPQSNQLFVLSGHSRLKTFQDAYKLGMKNKDTDFSHIPAKIIDGNKVPISEAVEIALLSNVLVSPESVTERAKYWRERIGKATTKEQKQELKEDAKRKERKNFGLTWALAHLKEGGRTEDFVGKFIDVQQDVEIAGNAMNIGYLVGKAMEAHPELTRKHEDEIFKYLKDDGMYGSNKVNTVGEITNIVGTATKQDSYKKDGILNLKKLVPKSSIETAAEAELKTRTKELRQAANTLYTAAQKRAYEMADKKEGSNNNYSFKTQYDAINNAIGNLKDAIINNNEAPKRARQEQALFE